jgi:hypothetical protein
MRSRIGIGVGSRESGNHVDELVVKRTSGVRLNEAHEPAVRLVGREVLSVPADIEQQSVVDLCVGEPTEDGADIRLGGASRDAQEEPSEPVRVLLGQGFQHLRLCGGASDEVPVPPVRRLGRVVVLHRGEPVAVAHVPCSVLGDRRLDGTSRRALGGGDVVALEFATQLGQAPLHVFWAAGRVDAVEEAQLGESAG